MPGPQLTPESPEVAAIMDRISRHYGKARIASMLWGVFGGCNAGWVLGSPKTPLAAALFVAVACSWGILLFKTTHAMALWDIERVFQPALIAAQRKAEEERRMMKLATPAYKHDCGECNFLGPYEWKGERLDLYYCKRSSAEMPPNRLGGTVLARYGEGSAVYTMPAGLVYPSLEAIEPEHPLCEARRRAIEAIASGAIR